MEIGSVGSRIAGLIAASSKPNDWAILLEYGAKPYSIGMTMVAAVSGTAGTDTVDSRNWLRDFRKALDRRINLKAGAPRWRKLSDSYLERLGNMRHVKDANYLRRYARIGASALAA